MSPSAETDLGLPHLSHTSDANPYYHRAMDLNEGYLTTTVDTVVNWARSNSLMPMPMGLACCAIEMMAFAGPKYDVARFGSEAMRFSPRQADLMLVAGWCSYKMAHAIRRVWDQMADPKWCIAMGACASSGGMHRCYGVVQGIDNSEFERAQFTTVSTVAVSFQEFLEAGVGLGVLGVVTVFIIILAVGLIYDIKKGGLEFD